MTTDELILKLFSTLSEEKKLLAIAMVEQLLAERVKCDTHAALIETKENQDRI